MKITHRFTSDLQIRTIPPRLMMVQGDCNSRDIEITVTSEGKPWIPANVDHVFLRYRKSDGTGGSYDTLPDGGSAWSLEENRITIRLVSQMLAVPGLVEAQAMLVSGSRMIATFTFMIVVEEDPSAQVLQSENYLNWSEWAKNELQCLLEQAKESGDFTGACYVPAVDHDGCLRWSKDTEPKDPEPVNIADMVIQKIDVDTLLGNMAGDLRMNGYRITGMAEPEDDQDAATKGYTQNLVKTAFPRNLLDNSNFENPVNQRGAASYENPASTWQYTIDRWKHSYGILTKNEGYINWTTIAAAGYKRIMQQIEHTLKSGCTYTLAVLARVNHVAGTVMLRPCTGTFGWMPGNPKTAITETTDDFVWITCTFTVSEDVTTPGFEIMLYNAPGDALNIDMKAWVLYEGEYGSEGMPEYRPKSYGAELAECQRYYYCIPDKNMLSGVITSGAKELVCQIPLPVPMRAPVPTVGIPLPGFTIRTVSGYSPLTPDGDSTVTAGSASVWVNQTCPPIAAVTISFKFSSAAGTNNTVANAYISSGKLTLSADL